MFEIRVPRNTVRRVEGGLQKLILRCKGVVEAVYITTGRKQTGNGIQAGQGHHPQRPMPTDPPLLTTPVTSQNGATNCSDKRNAFR